MNINIFELLGRVVFNYEVEKLQAQSEGKPLSEDVKLKLIGELTVKDVAKTQQLAALQQEVEAYKQALQATAPAPSAPAETPTEPLTPAAA